MFYGAIDGANAATDTQQPQTLRGGSEPTEGFDPMLGWSHGSYLLLHSPLLKQKADLSCSYMLENMNIQMMVKSGR